MLSEPSHVSGGGQPQAAAGACGMHSAALSRAVLQAWRISCRLAVLLSEGLPDARSQCSAISRSSTFCTGRQNAGAIVRDL